MLAKSITNRRYLIKQWKNATRNSSTLVRNKSFDIFTDSFSGCDAIGNTWDCCSLQKPCGVAEGHCEDDDECLNHFLCGSNNCLHLFPIGSDCCYDPIPCKLDLNLKYYFQRHDCVSIRPSVSP